MSEFSVSAAHRMPSTFSDDIRTPFEDIGMSNFSDRQMRELFADKTVLDIGSGLEGIARGLHALFGTDNDAPTVINLNPQFTDWRMKDYRENGKSKSMRLYKQDEISAGIRELMDLGGEDVSGYFARRFAVAGLVQQLPFPNKSVDIVTSTWAFPTSFYDCDSPDRDFKAAYGEIRRILRPGGGMALLGPLRTGQTKHTHDMLNHELYDNVTHENIKTGERWGGPELVIKLTKA